MSGYHWHQSPACRAAWQAYRAQWEVEARKTHPDEHIDSKRVRRAANAFQAGWAAAVHHEREARRKAWLERSAAVAAAVGATGEVAK